MISDEAVEAAAKALWQTDQHDDAWVNEYTEYMDYLRAEATKALEAAAPYIAARAWEEGEKTGYSNCLAVEHGLEQATNPYRSQARLGALDDALRMYGEGVALVVITERTGISYSALMKAKKDHGIPNRPQRADGTMRRSQA